MAILQDLPVKKDFCVRRGEDFAFNLFWKPGGVVVDLTDYRAFMTIRDVPRGTVLETLSTDTDGFQEIKTGLFTDSVAQWNIEILLPAARTKLMPVGNHTYDFLLVWPNPDVTSLFLLKGDFSVAQEITTNALV